ncbi:MAG: metal-dependent hydrolase [Promethearchaeota archaeon]
MQLFAHVGITLGSAWVLQKAAGRIKRSTLKRKPDYIAAASLGDRTTELSSSRASTANWLDYRFLLLGSMLPDIIDKPLGIMFLGNGRAFCHTLFFTMLILTAGIYFFLVRKKSALFCVALGCVAHVLLDSMWLNQVTFLWPLFGWSFPHNDISIGPWLERTFHNLLTQPSYYIPEVIGFTMLIFFCVDFMRNGKVSHLIKSRLTILYQNLFNRSKRKYASFGLRPSKESKASTAQHASLIERPVE